jgi:hypothetical protein
MQHECVVQAAESIKELDTVVINNGRATLLRVDPKPGVFPGPLGEFGTALEDIPPGNVGRVQLWRQQQAGEH